MKNLLLQLITLSCLTALYTSCSNPGEVPQSYTSAQLADLRIEADNHNFYLDAGTELEIKQGASQLVKDDVILSLDNQGAILIGKSDIMALKTDSITIDIVVDSNIPTNIALNQAWINVVLKKLNTGLQVRLNTKPRKDLAVVKTDGMRNTDKLLADLRPSSKYTAYLFESASFFNTANAFAIRVRERDADERVLLLGNAYLLQSPYLFVHELLHGFGLTHHNEMYEVSGGCDTPTAQQHKLPFFNVMHESNVGCARRLSGRQIMILNEDAYFPPVVDDPLFPNGSSCGCDFTKLGNHIERYLNGFDTNIDDTPLVGDDVMLLDHLAKVQGDILPADIAAVIRGNFEAEVVELGLSGSTATAYVDLRIETLKLQREYNLARWIKENMEAKGIAVDDSTFWTMNGDYSGAFDELVDRSLDEVAAEGCRQGCNQMIGEIDVCEFLRPKDGETRVSREEVMKRLKDRLGLNGSFAKSMDSVNDLKLEILKKLEPSKDQEVEEEQNIDKDPEGRSSDDGSSEIGRK